ncbi:hypothetical protein ABK040_003659 [Willaertia magna]
MPEISFKQTFAKALIDYTNTNNNSTTTQISTEDEDGNKFIQLNDYTKEHLEINNTFLCYGDYITIYMDIDNNQTFGFLSVEGVNLHCHHIKGNKKYIRCGLSESINSSDNNNNTFKYLEISNNNINSCIFQIHNANNYSCSKKYKQYKEQLDLNHFKKDEINLKLIQLKNLKEREEKQNKLESDRLKGKPIPFNESIQLFHVQTNMYLTIARESAEIQRDCLKLTLEKEGSTYSYFKILPCFNYQKANDEKIKFTDYFRFFNPKSNQFLHASYLRYSNNKIVNEMNSEDSAIDKQQDEKALLDCRREVNVSNVISFTKWRIKLYFKEIEKKENYLMIGQIIRIYHKELDGYLYVNEKTGRVKLVKKKVFNNDMTSEKIEKKKYKNGEKNESNLNENENNNNVLPCQTLWQIEMTNQTCGGLLRFNVPYRIRHLSTGKYLTIRKANEDDDEIENELETLEKAEIGIESFNELETGISMLKFSALSFYRQSMYNGLLTHRSHNTQQNKKELTINYLFVDNQNDGNNSFSLQSTNNTTNYIQNNSFFKLYNLNTSTWVNSAEYNSNLFNSYYTKVYTNKLFKENDVLTLEAVSNYDIDDTLTILSYEPPLNYCRFILSNNNANLSKDYIKLFIEIVSSCIRFCILSDDIDPHIGGGIPLKGRQQLLREKGIITIIMEIIILAFDKIQNSKTIFLNPEEHNFLIEIIDYGFYFIKQVVLMNETNGLYLGKYLNDIQNMIEYSLSASEALLSILSNNYTLLNQITMEQINFFIKLLLQKEISSLKKSIYLSFLTNLIICNGKIVSKNQKYISTLFFENYKENLHEIFIIPSIRKQDNKVIVSIDFDEMDLVSFSQSASQDDGPLYTKPNYDKLIFFQEQIKLFSTLCNGRSISADEARESIIELLTFDVILQCTFENNLIPSVRNSFVTLLNNCFIENGKYEKRIILSLTRKINQQHKMYDNIELRSIKLQLENYFKENTKVSLSNLEKNKYTLSLIRLIKNMLEFGIYQLTDFSQSILFLSLFKLLVSDIAMTSINTLNLMNLIGKSIANETTTNNDDENQEEIKHTESYIVIVNLKIEIANIFHMIMDLIIDKRISKFLQFFVLKYKEGDIKTSLIDEEELFNMHYKNKNKSELKKQKKLHVKRIQQLDFKENQLLTDLFIHDNLFHNLEEFDNHILNMTKVDNLELSSLCFRLLIRKYRTTNEFADFLPKIDMITSSGMAKTLDKLTKRTLQLHSLLNSHYSTVIENIRKLSEHDAKRITKILREILDELKENIYQSQRILRNLNTYEIILTILTKKELIVPNLIIEKCFKCLKHFAKNNFENQKLLFPYLNTFIQLIGINTQINKIKSEEDDKIEELVVKCCCEIVKNNKALCSVIEERLIELFIDKMADNKKPYMIDFLNIILVRNLENNNPIKRNQIIVVKYLIKRKKDVLILFKDEESQRELNLRIKNEEHLKEPNGILNYHIKLLHLLSAIADAKNKETEMRVQSLFSLQELLEKLLSPFTNSILRNPLTNIVNEVYVNIEKTGNQQFSTLAQANPIKLYKNRKLDRSLHINIHHSLFYRLLLKMCKELDIFINHTINNNFVKRNPFIYKEEKKETIQSTNSVLLATPPKLKPRPPVHPPPTILKKNYNFEDEKKFFTNIDHYYIFQVMIPLIYNYYHIHFPPPNVTEEQLDISELLVIKLIELYTRSCNPKDRDKVYKCIVAMWKKSMSSNCQKIITNFTTSKITQIKVIHFRISNDYNKILENDEMVHLNYKKYLKSRILPKIEFISDFSQLTKLYDNNKKFINILIDILRKQSNTKFKAPEILQIGCVGLDIVKDIVKTNKELDFAIESKIVQVVIELINSSNHNIVRSALILGKLILKNGEKRIQDEMVKFLNEKDSTNFFLSLRDRIRIAKFEIKERKNYLQKKKDTETVLFRQQDIKIKHKEYHSKDNNFELEINEFIEIGCILDLLEFLNLFCEGNNNSTQTILNTQPHNRISIDIINEIIEYMVILSKKIDADNIKIAIQLFKTLTSSIQGPCNANIQTIRNSAKFFSRCINQIMSFQFENSTIAHKDELELKKELTLTLISLLETNEKKSMVEVMKFSLNLEYFTNPLLFCCKFLQSLLSEEKSLEVDIIQKRLKKDYENYQNNFLNEKYNFEKYISKMYSKIKNQLEDFGLHIYFLLNILKDGEKDILMSNKNNSITLANDVKDDTFSVQQFLQQHCKELSILQQQTGNIEVLRGNVIEKIYFRKKFNSYLIDKARSNYVNNIDILTPQEKVFKLYNDTFSKFYIEMCHYQKVKEDKESNSLQNLEDKKIKPKKENNTNFTIPSLATIQSNIMNNTKKEVIKKRVENFTPKKILYQVANTSTLFYEYIGNRWDFLQLLSFFFSVMINIVLLYSYKRIFLITSYNDIPLPGDDSFSIMTAKKAAESRNFISDLILKLLGLVQIFITMGLIVIYMKLFMPLEIKKRFKLNRKEKWENIPKNRQFYLKYIKYIFQDLQIWFFLIYFLLSLLGLLINPIIYSIQLFEMIFRFPTLMDILKSILVNSKKLIATGLLLIVVLFGFSIIYFSYYRTDFVLKTDGQYTCDSLLLCFVTILDYGFRSDSAFENLYPHDIYAGRAFVDILFFLFVILILVNVVFGTILDSFQQIRKERELKKNEIRNKCFICALERNKFDQYANEGLTFEKHVKEEHYLWNYVYFLIYLYEKPFNEYSGIEQYIYERCEQDDVASFCPIFRSKSLEEIESRNKNNHFKPLEFI